MISFHIVTIFFLTSESLLFLSGGLLGPRRQRGNCEPSATYFKHSDQHFLEFFSYIYIHTQTYIYFIELQLTYNVPCAQQGDSFIHIIFEIIFHYRLLQVTGDSCLCYTVNLCCLLHIYIFVLRNLAFYSY